MTYVALKKGADNQYGFTEANESLLGTLGDFLCFEVGGKSLFFIEWIIDSNSPYDGISGNVYFLNKIDGLLYLTNVFDEQINDEGISPNSYITTPEQMHFILLQWQKILDMNPRPNYVVITQNEDKVIITPRETLEIHVV
jgi:hypothetical protein